MYLILLSNRLWYEADTLQEVKDFVLPLKRNTNYNVRVLKCYEQGVWEEIKIGE